MADSDMFDLARTHEDMRETVEVVSFNCSQWALAHGGQALSLESCWTSEILSRIENHLLKQTIRGLPDLNSQGVQVARSVLHQLRH